MDAKVLVFKYINDLAKATEILKKIYNERLEAIKEKDEEKSRPTSRFYESYFFDIEPKAEYLYDYILKNEDKKTAFFLSILSRWHWCQAKYILKWENYDYSQFYKVDSILYEIHNWYLMNGCNIHPTDVRYYYIDTETREVKNCKTREVYCPKEPQPEQAAPEPQQMELKDLLPEELKAEEAVRVFQKAIDAKLITYSPEGLKWSDTKQLLAYFATKVSEKFSLTSILDRDGNKTTSWRPFEILFNKQGLKGAKQNWMRLNTKFVPTGFEKVDSLF